MNVLPSNNDKKRLIIPVKKAIQEFNMIKNGDRIAIGLSGGKDSSTLLYVLTFLQKQLPIDFTIVPISLTLGFQNCDISLLHNFVKELGNNLHVKSTEISKIVFDYRKEKNPCSLCANLRRGAVNQFAKELNCNKVAYGHHLDDALETYFLNFFYNGKMGTFQPNMYLDQANISIIRPLINVEEKHIINFVKTKNIPIVPSPCPADKNTKREEIKQLVNELSKKYPDIRKNFSNSVRNIDLKNFWTID